MNGFKFGLMGLFCSLLMSYCRPKLKTTISPFFFRNFTFNCVYLFILCGFKAKGEGGGKIYIPSEQTSTINAVEPSIVLNGGEIFATAARLKNKEKWILGGIGMAFVALFVIIISVFKSKQQKKKKSSKSVSPSKQKQPLNRNSSNKENPANTHNNNMDVDELDEAESIYQKHNHLQQQQQVLICNSNSNTTNTNSNGNNAASNASTLLKQQQQSAYMQRTPSHHPQALIINNPNHMMMNLMNPLSINNNTGLGNAYKSSQLTKLAF